MIAVRCFTCGKVVGNLWEPYKHKLQQDLSPNQALDQLGLNRYCCRRMLISHLELSDKFLMYNCSVHIDSNEISHELDNDGSAKAAVAMNIQQQMLRVSSPFEKSK